MSKTHPIDHAFQEGNRWLNEINKLTGWADKEKAYIALRVTLQLLRDNLTLNTCAKLASELSPFIRGVFYENWRPVDQPLKERNEIDFIANVEELLDQYKHFEINPTLAITSVFTVLKNNIDVGEVEKINAQLSKGLRKLFEQA